MRAAFSARASSSIIWMLRRAAAAATGCPPKVITWRKDTRGLPMKASAMFLRVMAPPIGM